MSSAPTVDDSLTAAPATPGRPWWALPVVIAAVVAVAVAAVIGIRGLLGNPIRATGADGTATIVGTFEPFDCAGCPPQGYVQAGARSVFVVFRTDCPTPQRGTGITVHARQDNSLGKQAYRAVDCPSPG